LVADIIGAFGEKAVGEVELRVFLCTLAVLIRVLVLYAGTKTG
jgi:hypothetical protein